MRTSTTITTIGATHGSKFITQKMPEACTAMSAAAKNAYLINKITFFQNCIFIVCYEGFSFNYVRNSTNEGRLRLNSGG